MAHSETPVLHIVPAQTCAHCPRLTSKAVVVESIFLPACPLHDYVYPYDPLQVTHAELERQSESVKRFVVWMYGEQGRVILVSPVHNLLTIPGYQELPEQEVEDDRGFYVGYVSPAGEHAEVYVIWSAVAHQFFFYQDGREYKDRACTWIESGVAS
jgi:hypothetical protein